MAAYIDALPSGSYVALTHFLDLEANYTELARRLEGLLAHSPLGNGWFRSRTEIADMLPGLELVESGLVRCVDWWPDGPRIKQLEPAQALATTFSVSPRH
jgi:hypothetical protein